MSRQLKEMVEQLGIVADRAIKLYSGGSSLHHSFDVEPEDFLQQAEDDYERGGKAALLNAITNAKRAIHSQTDEVLFCLGFDPSRWKIGKKVELLVSMGFVAPRILRRVTKARNILEHEYTAPTLEQVEEALDLAALFIEATNRHLESFGHEFNIGNSDEQVDLFHCARELSFHFDDSERRFNVWGRCNVRPESERQRAALIGEAIVEPSDSLFRDIVRLVVAGDRDAKTAQALAQFFATLRQC